MPLIKGKALRIDITPIPTPYLLSRIYPKAKEENISTLRKGSFRRELFTQRAEELKKIAREISNFFEVSINFNF